jgi:Icc-related predicted phosphoesterase
MNITFISDTHTATPKLSGGDLLIHAGDLTYKGRTKETKDQLDWIAAADYTHKIIIPGNHEVAWEAGHVPFERYCKERGIICLNEEEVTIEGIKIFGSPITPEFCGWAYMRRSDIVHNWEKIPLDTDILITHGPPRGILDTNDQGQPCGCPALRKRVAEVKPVVHVFGHIHEAYGEHQEDATWFANVAIMNRDYQPVNKPTNLKWRG